jgi:predicted acyltransferase
MPWQFKHHREGMSYADTIAPAFIFVVGMGFRLSLRRRSAELGLLPALLSTARRYATLVLIGIVIYNPADWSNWWDALVDIGAGGLIALPFIALGPVPRAVAAFGCIAAFQGIFSLTEYGPWLMHNSFNGGPLGVIAWAGILLFGTLAQDIAERPEPWRVALGLFGWGLGLCALGLALEAEWPGVKPHWPHSQYYMTAPYALLSTGWAFLAYGAFHLLCDRAKILLPHLSTLGSNPLAIYILQYALIGLHGAFLVERGASAPWALLSFAAFYAVCYAVALYLQRRNIYIKV